MTVEQVVAQSCDRDRGHDCGRGHGRDHRDGDGGGWTL